MKREDFKFHWPLVGNGHITEFLGKSIVSDRLASTYIFNGPDNLGKTTLANYFAQVLLCDNRKGIEPCGICSSCRSFLLPAGENLELGSTHADFHILKKEKDKKNISVGQVRDFIRSLNLSSFSGFYKVGVIKHADKLSLEAANALLKTLEEPKKGVVVILITQNMGSLPQTIVSRSQVLNFRLVSTDTIYDYLVNSHGAGRVEAKNFARLSLGRPALALKFFEDSDFRDKYNRQVEIFLGFLRENLNTRLGMIDEIIDKKIQGQEAVQLAKRTIEVWQGVARDILLLFYNHNNIIQHQQIENLSRPNLSVMDLLHFQALCRQGEDYLNNNVNPKLVLENIAISL